MVVLDVETTGLNPIKHSIVEIGALDFNNPSNEFYQKCKVFEGAEVDPMALKVNGYDNSQLLDSNRIGLKEMVLKFIEWIDKINDRTIAGHNVDFDINFLNQTLIRYNIKYNFGWRKVDQHTLVYTNHLKNGKSPPIKNGFSNLDGDNIMRYVGLPEEPKPHTGINGAKFEAEAMSRLIYGKGLLKEFDSFEVSKELIKNQI
ncbi:3'-5' exonuclease [uncultured Psychroserpens sp.]|uniref:3'-5' exonuclease n=1 Tax=uncultured Psychroserpens sp. TaxID=255436 RepID=UPI002621925E|nr:3'-5' exonuclease [uncultured Psychroserpens sp.]